MAPVAMRGHGIRGWRRATIRAYAEAHDLSGYPQTLACSGGPFRRQGRVWRLLVYVLAYRK